MKKNVWIMNHYASGMYFDKGGRHYNFAKYLKRGGYTPVVFCCNTKHGKPEAFFPETDLWKEHLAEEIGVPFVFVRARTYEGNGKQRVLNMIDFCRNVKKSAKKYAKVHGKPDVIYASSVHPLTLVAGIQLAKAFHVKCICEVRDLWPETIVAYGTASAHNPAVMALRWLEKWIYKNADAVIFTMEGAYDYIIERGWEKAIPRSKVYYINNGVDLEVFSYNQEHFRVDDPDLSNPNIFKVVYAGSIRRINNLGLLLDAAKEIQNPKVKILVWGDGDERAELEKRVQEEKIENIVFKGYVEKKYIPYIVSQANLNIVHSESTPLLRFGISPNKLFDYLAAGKPILFSFSSKYNPAVRCGAGVEPKSQAPREVAKEIDKISNLPEDIYQQYCTAAKKGAEEYDFQVLTRKLIAVICRETDDRELSKEKRGDEEEKI